MSNDLNKRVNKIIQLLKNESDNNLKLLKKYCDYHRVVNTNTFDGKIEFIKLLNKKQTSKYHVKLYLKVFEYFKDYIFTDNIFKTIASQCKLVINSIFNIRKEYLQCIPTKLL